MEALHLSELGTSSDVFKFYGRIGLLGFVGIVSTAISYPLSIRFVKKVFGLKEFLNIHFVNNV